MLDQEGTVPVPPYRPCADCDDNVFPVQMLSHLGGAEAAGVKPLLSVQVFLNISTERAMSLWLIDEYEKRVLRNPHFQIPETIDQL